MNPSRSVWFLITFCQINSFILSSALTYQVFTKQLHFPWQGTAEAVMTPGPFIPWLWINPKKLHHTEMTETAHASLRSLIYICFEGLHQMLIVLTELFYFFFFHFNIAHYSKRREKQVILTVFKSYIAILFHFPPPSSTMKATQLMPLFYNLSWMWKVDSTAKPLFFIKNKGSSLWTWASQG